MPELVIRNPDDIKKLAGWNIISVGVAPGGIIVMKIQHPAAARDVMVLIQAEVDTRVVGNILQINKILGVKTQDVIEEKSE